MYKAFATILWLMFASAIAKADDAVLTSQDNLVTLSGTLLSFDGEYYRIDTEYGVLTVDASAVECDGPACPSLTPFVARIRISGAQHLGRVLIPALIEGFARRNGYAVKRDAVSSIQTKYVLMDGINLKEIAQFFITSSTTSQGFTDLLNEETDLVLATRQVKSDESDAIYNAGLGDISLAPQTRVVALDGMVPIVAATNPVSSISIKQLSQVYAGEITNWSALGGEDATITPYLTDVSDGLGEKFIMQVMEPQNLERGESVKVLPNMASLNNAIIHDPFAISIKSFTNTEHEKRLKITGNCPFSVQMTANSIKSEDYPLVAPMFMYVPERRLPLVGRDFLKYINTDGAQLAVRRSGFVDQAIMFSDVSDEGNRLANAILASGTEIGLKDLKRLADKMATSERLTLSFRFEGGEVQLDAASRSNIALIIDAIQSGRFDEKTLSFVGFSDGEGPADANLRLAKKRAVAVHDLVTNSLSAEDQKRLTFDIDAFGEALPLACDDTSWGRGINRRVELWVW